MLSCQIIFQRASRHTQKTNTLPNSDYVRVNGKILYKGCPVLVTHRKDGYVYGQMLVEDPTSFDIDVNGNKSLALMFKQFRVKDYGNKFTCSRSDKITYYFDDAVTFDVDYTKDLITMIKEFSTKKYWVSWRQYTNKWESANNPIGTSIENVWCSGTSSSFCKRGFPLYHNVCAVVVGTSKEDATKSILADWPEATRDDWRFFDEKPIDWSPVGGRFS